MFERRVPDVIFKTRIRDDSKSGDNPFRWKDITSGSIFSGRRVVIFSLPGAFTPTCSTYQLPSFEKLHDEFLGYNIDGVYCISVNDAFVMNAWARDLGIKNVKMIPDGDGAFTRSLGMLINKPLQGFGMRSWRYSALIDNKEIVQFNEEPGMNNLSLDDDPYTVSDPNTMLKYLGFQPN